MMHSRVRRGTSQGWWLECGGWLGLGFVLLGALAGAAQDAAAQVDSRQLDVQVNLPYAVQFEFGSYDVGGLSVNVFRVPVPHTFALGPEEDAWRLVLTGYLGYGHFSFETRVFGPKSPRRRTWCLCCPRRSSRFPYGGGGRSNRMWRRAPAGRSTRPRPSRASQGGSSHRRGFDPPVRGWDQQPL